MSSQHAQLFRGTGCCLEVIRSQQNPRAMGWFYHPRGWRDSDDFYLLGEVEQNKEDTRLDK
jgi:hypothetical protein